MRILLLYFVLLCSAAAAQAQTKDSLIVTLKNGQTMKIDLDDIQKITFQAPAAVEQAEMQAAPQVTSFPNPASGSTTIAFSIESSQLVAIEICNSLGQVIRRIEKQCAPGDVLVDWDGLTDDGSRAATGSYIIRVITREATLSSHLNLTR